MTCISTGLLWPKVWDHEVASVCRAASGVRNNCFDRILMYLAPRCLERLLCNRAYGIVLWIFAVFKVFVEEISSGGTPISNESLPWANDDTLGKRVGVIRCRCRGRLLFITLRDCHCTSWILKRAATLKATCFSSVARLLHVNMVMVVVMDMRHVVMMVYYSVLEYL